MLGVVQDDTFSRNESTRGRIVCDVKDEQSLISVLEQHNVFLATSYPETLYSIATKDLATDKIQDSLLNVKGLGLASKTFHTAKIH